MIQQREADLYCAWCAQVFAREKAVRLIRTVLTRVSGMPLSLLMLTPEEHDAWQGYRAAWLATKDDDTEFVPEPSLAEVRLHRWTDDDPPGTS